MSSRETDGWPRLSYSALTACVRVRWSTDQSSIEAWPFESTNRSRLGQIGSCGSKRRTRFQSVYTSGASAIGVPGCPDFACLTASIERVRIVLIANCTIFSSVIIFSSRFFLRFACLYGSHFAQAPQVSLGLAECGGQECLDEVPGDGWPYGPAAHTQDVQVIVLDPLPGREVVVDERRADALNLVGTHCRTHTAAADRHSAFHLPGGNGPRERHDVVGIVIVLAQAMRAEIDDLMPRGAQLAEQFFLQMKSTVIRGHANAHRVSPLILVLPPLGRRAPGQRPSESGRPESTHHPRATARALSLCPGRSRATGC